MSGAVVLVGGVDVSAACLDALVDISRPPSLVVGYDDTRRGASGFVDVARRAAEIGIPAVRSADVNGRETAGQIEAAAPELLYVIGWSQLVKRPLLELPKRGAVGIHPTLLPEGRGRAPIPWTILKGLDRTASTMFFLTEGVDDGDVIGRVEIEVAPGEDAGTLYAKHRRAHGELVARHTAEIVAGQAVRRPQEHSRATYWSRRTPEDGRIDWSRGAEDVHRLVRAVTHPFPGAFTESLEGRVTIWRAEPVSGHRGSEPGTPVEDDGVPVVACGAGGLRVLEADGPPGWAARGPLGV